MLEVGDAEFVVSLYGSPGVTRTLLRVQRPLSIEEAREFCQMRATARGDYRFGAALLDSGKLIGLGTVRADAKVPGVVSVGYSVLPVIWGQGFGTELAALLVEFSAAVLGALEVRATTLDDNPASSRVLEKLGFTALEVGASELDSRGEERHVTRWALHMSRQSPWTAEQRPGADRLDAGRSA
jgi:RimJ/RimL family protein N-acetyltransferase